MKKYFLWFLAAIVLSSFALTACTDIADNNGGSQIVEPKDEYSIFVMSDIHVMAPELLVKKGPAFEKYVKTDPKLLEESGEMLNAVTDVVLEKRPDLVLIPGDLTKDGELLSHQLVVSILERVRTAGIPVIVIPGNHDIDNPEGVYFTGDETRPAERTSTTEFAELYRNYGYTRPETVRDPASLSFACEPLPGLVLICLDSNLYEENLFVERGDSIDHNQTSGRIREATLEWMWRQADAARAAGKQVVAMQHHNAVEHYDGQATLQSTYVVQDYQKVAEGMMQHGIHLVFTGHQHLQDIAQFRTDSEVQDSLIDISTGAAVSYPNPWRIINVNRDFTQWSVETGYVKSIPSIADVQQECYKLLSSNVVNGLVWHINEYWPVIDSYRSTLSDYGLPTVLLPSTPQEAGSLLMEYLGPQLTEAFMIHNAGNENENPRGQIVISEFEDALSKLCRRQLKGNVNDEVLDAMVILLNGIMMTKIRPLLTSMLTDTNQAEYSWLSSRTNDLNAVLTIPQPSK